MSGIAIYHNPRCGTSRNALAMIRERGFEPTVIEYLEDPPDRDRLRALARDSGVGVRGLVRAKEPLYAELGLDDPALDDEALLDAMLAHPVLINRPIVVTPVGTRLCRPADTVLEILPGA
jgi:arsenate reductase